MTARGSIARSGSGLGAVFGPVLDAVMPPFCAGCGQVGAACCPACLCVWAAPRPVVRGPTEGRVPVYALSAYRGVARRIVLAHKERGRRDLSRPLGRALAGALQYLPAVEASPEGAWWLVPVPSRRPAARVRGGSHVLALARHCAGALASAPSGGGAYVAPALRLDPGARDAVGLSRRQREANLEGRLRVVPAKSPPPGTQVILLDDVVTTGATAAACVAALGSAGIAVSAVLALTAAG